MFLSLAQMKLSPCPRRTPKYLAHWGLMSVRSRDGTPLLWKCEVNCSIRRDKRRSTIALVKEIEGKANGNDFATVYSITKELAIAKNLVNIILESIKEHFESLIHKKHREQHRENSFYPNLIPLKDCQQNRKLYLTIRWLLPNQLKKK